MISFYLFIKLTKEKGLNNPSSFFLHASVAQWLEHAAVNGVRKLAALKGNLEMKSE